MVVRGRGLVFLLSVVMATTLPAGKELLLAAAAAALCPPAGTGSASAAGGAAAAPLVTRRDGATTPLHSASAMPESRPLPASAASEVAEARGGDVWIAREEETGNGGRTDGGGTDAARKRSALLGKEGDQEREGEAFTLGGGGGRNGFGVR